VTVSFRHGCAKTDRKQTIEGSNVRLCPKSKIKNGTVLQNLTKQGGASDAVPLISLGGKEGGKGGELQNTHKKLEKVCRTNTVKIPVKKIKINQKKMIKIKKKKKKMWN